MPLENSLNVSPYFDDYNQAKEFYKILFKPGVAVQTRELNQLQSILQNQVERFGNHIFKSGTIISGVNFSYLPNYSYIKILDVQGDGQPSLPSSYVDYFVKSNLNLTARVVNYEDGLESKSPNLNTLYLQYVSSSDQDVANGDAVYTSFSSGESLTVFGKDYPLFKITANSGGLGFSNSDSIVVMSAVTVSGNTVAFSNGETITQSSTGAQAVIAAINTTAVANTIILSVQPRTVDLTNIAVNSAAWSLSTGYNVVGGSSGATANVTSAIGSSATALLTTDTQGIIQTVTLVNNGYNYTYLPRVTVKTSNATATVNSLDLIPQNYKTTVIVGNNSIASVGTGYAFGVSSGLIYQKGYFLKVDPQVVVIDKYTTTPTAVAVGFKTIETNIAATADETLYDNAADTTNYSAPGADRLRLTPTLIKVTTDEAAANVDFFALAEWKEGYAYKENRNTVYSSIGDEMARTTKESLGNFVVDPFMVGSKEKPTLGAANVYTTIDQGLAYINGYRTSTNYNTYLETPRANVTETSVNSTIAVNYGNYVKIKELAGFFNFKAGAQISLRSAVKNYVSTATIGASPSITAAGSEIGVARIRSLVVDSGNPGTADCVYRLYLFDIQMNAGYSFRSVRSVFYDSTEDGVADIATQYDATAAANVAVLVDKSFDKMLFATGHQAVQTVDNINFQYRTSSDTTLQLTSAGQLAIGPLGSGLTFPYSDGALSSTQKKDFIILPIANAQVSANVSGFMSLNTSTDAVTGTSTTFATDVEVGDFLKFANATASIVGQVKSIANNTYLTLNANAAATMVANAVIFYPAMYPLSLENRSARTITISGSSKTATLNMTKTLLATVNAIAVYNIEKSNAVPVSKTINRNLYVKIHTSNNSAGSQGPWHLGVPGVARLKNVYLGSNTTVNTASTDVTKYFYIDINDDQSVYRSSKLVLSNRQGITLTANQFIMVKFDAFTTGGAEGFFTTDSYSVNDSANLASSTATINTLEIPETVTKVGEYYDLRDTIDFRPYATNTAVLSTTAAGASINPSSTLSLSGDDQFFPVPDSTVSYDVTYYLPRKDSVTVDVNKKFETVQGTPSMSPKLPVIRGSHVILGNQNIPPYPTLPRGLNALTLDFAAKQVGNERGIVDIRVKNHTINVSTSNPLEVTQPKRFTMSDINKLENRITRLEYQATLNGIEQQIKDTTIPSGITPTTSRFKNGFFVEPFNDFSRAETTNKEFRASIDLKRSLLKPLVQHLNFESQFDRTDATTLNNIYNDTSLLLPFTEEVLVNQSIKSSVLGSDGHKVQFVGDARSTPTSFSIAARMEVIPDPPPPVIVTIGAGGYSEPSYGGYDSAGGGTGGGDSGGGGSGSGSGCFLTTATVQYMGLPDDCKELTFARMLRDNIMSFNEPSMVELYDIVGPILVARKTSWDDFFVNVITPLTTLCEQKQYNKALTIYKMETVNLIDQYATNYSDKDVISAVYDYTGLSSAPYFIKYVCVKGLLKMKKLKWKLKYGVLRKEIT